MLSDMSIYIPTWRRPGQVRTLRQIPAAWADRTFLVVRPEEETAHDWPKVLVLPPEIQNLGATRDWIVRNASTDFVMQMDDDLTIDYRPDQYAEREPGEDQESYDKRRRRLAGPAPEDVVDDMLNVVWQLLRNGVAHVGISTREGQHLHPDPVASIGRMTRCFAHDRRVLLRHGVIFDRHTSAEDFDVTLQLLRLGYANNILYQWSQGQPGTNTPGGVSEYRDARWQDEGAQRLADLHPGFVKIVRRKANNWGGFEGERTDVRISWAAAYKSSQAPLLDLFGGST